MTNWRFPLPRGSCNIQCSGHMIAAKPVAWQCLSAATKKTDHRGALSLPTDHTFLGAFSRQGSNLLSFRSKRTSCQALFAEEKDARTVRDWSIQMAEHGIRTSSNQNILVWQRLAWIATRVGRRIRWELPMTRPMDTTADE